MNTILTAVMVYFAIGFAKWTLDMSRLPFLHKLIVCIDGARAEADKRERRGSAELLAVMAFGMTLQTFLFWPEILLKEGVTAFLQPISKRRAAEVFGSAAGIHVEVEEDD